MFSKKKKKKGLHSESSSEQTSAANPKLYVLFSRGGLRRLPHSPHPISTTVQAFAWLNWYYVVSCLHCRAIVGDSRGEHILVSMLFVIVT